MWAALVNTSRKILNIDKILIFYLFLALLDYVSRAHEIEIRTSSVRPSVASIISEGTAWIAFKFQL